MNRDLLFGGPAPTGAAAVDSGWARRQELLGLPTDPAVPPSIQAANLAANNANLSKRDAVWEAKRQKRLQGQSGLDITPVVEPAAAAPLLHPSAPFQHLAATQPQTSQIQQFSLDSREFAPLSVPRYQPDPAGTSPMPRSSPMEVPSAVGSVPSWDSLRPSGVRSPPKEGLSAVRSPVKEDYAAELQAQMEEKRRREQASRQRAKDEASGQHGFLASAVGEKDRRAVAEAERRAMTEQTIWQPPPPEVYRRGDTFAASSPYDGASALRSAQPMPDVKAAKAVVAAEYARELEAQVMHKKQADMQRRHHERALAQHSNGIADIISSSSSHARIMQQVQQQTKSKSLAVEAFAPCRPDSLDMLQRHRAEELSHSRPVSASDAYSRLEPGQPWGPQVIEPLRRNSGGPSLLTNAGSRAVDLYSEAAELRRIQSAQPIRPPASLAPWEKVLDPLARAPASSTKDNKEAYAEELRRQMAERDDRKRREKAISLAPSYVPSSRHAARREEAVTRDIYLRSVSPGPQPVESFAPQYMPSAATYSAAPGAYGTHHQPHPSLAPPSQYPHMYGHSGSDSARGPPWLHSQAGYAQPTVSPAYFAPVSAVSPAGDPEAFKKAEEQRKRDQYALELENQIRLTQQRKEEEKMRLKQEDMRYAPPTHYSDVQPQQYGSAVRDFPLVRNGSDRLAPESPWQPEARARDGFAKAASDLRPGLEPELVMRKAKLQEEAALALEAQINEKAQRKREEAARRRAEEAEEEERLSRERALIAKRFADEEEVKKAEQEEETRKALEAQIAAKKRQREMEAQKEKALQDKADERFERQQREIREAFDRERAVEDGVPYRPEPVSPLAAADMKSDSPVPVGASARADLFGAAEPLPITQQPVMDTPSIAPFGFAPPAPTAPIAMQAVQPAQYFMSMMPTPWGVPTMAPMVSAVAPGYMPVSGYPLTAQPAQTTAWMPAVSAPGPFDMRQAEMRPSTSQATRSKLEAHEQELTTLKAELAAVRNQAADNAFINGIEKAMTGAATTSDMIGRQGLQAPLTPRQIFDHNISRDFGFGSQKLDFNGTAASPTVGRTQSRLAHDPLLMSIQGESRFLMLGPTSGAGDMHAADRAESLVADGLFLPSSSTFEPGMQTGELVSFGAPDRSRSPTPSPPPSRASSLRHLDGRGYPLSTSPSQLSLVGSPSRNAMSERSASPKPTHYNPEEEVIAAIDGLLKDTMSSGAAFNRQARRAATFSPPSPKENPLDASFAPSDFMRVSAMLPQAYKRPDAVQWTGLDHASPRTGGPSVPASHLAKDLRDYGVSLLNRPQSNQSSVSATPSEMHPSAQLSRKLPKAGAVSGDSSKMADGRPPRGVTWGLVPKRDRSISEGDSSDTGSTDSYDDRRRRGSHRSDRRRRRRRGSSSSMSSSSESYSESDTDDRRRRRSSSQRKSPRRKNSSHRRQPRRSADDPVELPQSNNVRAAAAPAPELSRPRNGPVVLQRGTPDDVLKELGKQAGRLAGETRWMPS